MLKRDHRFGGFHPTHLHEAMKSLLDASTSFCFPPYSGTERPAGVSGQSGLCLLPGFSDRSGPAEPGSCGGTRLGAVRKPDGCLGVRKETADPEREGDEGEGRAGETGEVSRQGCSSAGVATVRTELKQDH